MKKEYVFLDSFVSISIKNFLKEKKTMDANDITKKARDIEERYSTKLLSASEVSDYLGIDGETVNRLADNGELDYTMAGGERRFKAVQIACFELDIKYNVDAAYISSPAANEREVDIMKITKGSIYKTKSNKNPFEMRFFITFDDGVKRSVKIRGMSEEEVTQKKESKIAEVLEEYRAEKNRGSNIQNGINTDSSMKTDGTPTLPTMTFREVSEIWFKEFKQENESKGNTFSNLECAEYSLKAINLIIGNMNIGMIDKTKAQEMINAISIKANGTYYSKSHVDKIMQTFRKVMDYAFEHGYIDKPVGKLYMNKNLGEPNKDERFIDKSDMKRLLECVKENEFYNTLVRLIISSGLRQEEALALGIDDIKEINGICCVHVSKAVVQKDKYDYVVVNKLKQNEEARYIPIPKKVYETVREYYRKSIENKGVMEKRKQNGTEKLIFVNQEGKVHNKNTLYHSFRNYLKTNMEGGKKITLHMLRHTYASNMKNKINLDEVSEILGHADVSVTKKFYVSQTVEGLRRVSAAAEEMIRNLEE